MCPICMIPSKGLAQQIEAEVRLTLERLPLEKQEKLKNFGEKIELYINQYDWTGELLEDKIPVIIQIYLQDNSVSYEERYNGTFMISNNTDMQYYDKYWKFAYESGSLLTHSDSYDPFTGFINYYIYLILGGEYDKFGSLLGTPYFEKAKHITDQAMFIARFSIGWEERGEQIGYILGDDYKPFREAKDLYYLGLSYIGEEDSTAQKIIRQAASNLMDIVVHDRDHKDAINFLRAHHLDILDVLRGDHDFIEKLIKMDPDRAETYKKYLEY